MPNPTTNNSLSKICNPNDQSVNLPLLEMWEIAVPTPVRIDAPDTGMSSFVQFRTIRLQIRTVYMQTDRCSIIVATVH